MFTESYVGGDPDDDRFPLKWPKTYLSVGKKDPLYDDSILLMEKLNKIGVESKCRVYPEFSHGFLSTDFIINECDKAL
jgi:acetyl esterase/lipase